MISYSARFQMSESLAASGWHRPGLPASGAAAGGPGSRHCGTVTVTAAPGRAQAARACQAARARLCLPVSESRRLALRY